MVKCSRCGASFDYDKRQGVCPKCCFYNRPPGAARQDMEWLKYYNAEDNSYQLPKMENRTGKSGNQSVQRVKRLNKKRTEKSFPLGKVIGFLVPVCIILVGVMSFLKSTDVADWHFGSEKEVPESAVITVETRTMEEAAEGITAGDITYWVGETKTLFREGEISDMPSGEKCIGIWMENNESVLEYTGFDWERAYVYDGSNYRRMVDVESLDDKNTFIKNGIVSFPVYEVGYEDKSGYGIFFVDADASAVTLSLPCQAVDKEDTEQVEYTKVIDIAIPLT